MILAALAWTPARLDAQLIDFRFVALDMYGGGVWPDASRVGVAFGGRLGFADVLGRAARVGFELVWWTSDLENSDLAVRDALGGLAFWIDLVQAGAARPYLGVAAALHSIDVSRRDGNAFELGEALEADRLEGIRVGASGFVGLALRVSRTGAIWLVGEYRYTTVAEIPYHEARLGFRLLGSGD